jgi:hypothetical protein
MHEMHTSPTAGAGVHFMHLAGVLFGWGGRRLAAG